MLNWAFQIVAFGHYLLSFLGPKKLNVSKGKEFNGNKLILN